MSKKYYKEKAWTAITAPHAISRVLMNQNLIMSFQFVKYRTEFFHVPRTSDYRPFGIDDNQLWI